MSLIERGEPHPEYIIIIIIPILFGNAGYKLAASKADVDLQITKITKLCTILKVIKLTDIK